MNEENTITTEENAPDQESLPEIVGQIRADYETRIAQMTEQHNAAIADRDAIIRQLISGKEQKTENAIVERINEKRKYKKW